MLKDKVIRIVILTGAEKKPKSPARHEPVSKLLDEVDEAMKKSNLFSMTQLGNT